MTGWSPDPYADGPVDPNYRQPPAPSPPPQPYPQPASWELANLVPSVGIPGAGLAGVIIALVVAAMQLLAGLVLFIGASVLSGLAAPDVGYSPTEFLLAGSGDLIGAAVLASGGGLLVRRRPAGRPVLAAGAGLTLLLAGYWSVRFPSAGTVFWATIFVAAAALACVLVWQSRVSRWLAAPVSPAAGHLVPSYGPPPSLPTRF